MKLIKTLMLTSALFVAAGSFAAADADEELRGQDAFQALKAASGASVTLGFDVRVDETGQGAARLAAVLARVNPTGGIVNIANGARTAVVNDDDDELFTVGDTSDLTTVAAVTAVVNTAAENT